MGYFDLIPQNSWFRNESNNDANRGSLSAMRNTMDQLVNEFTRATTCSHCASPRVNISENEAGVEIEAELPGVEEKDIEVSLDDDVLTIKGEKRMEREEQKKDYTYQERKFGRFERSINLSFEPDAKAVKAVFAKGLLKVTVPKSASAIQNKVKIPIKAIV